MSADKKQHLTFEGRKAIEMRLNDGKFFNAISQEIGVSPSTIGREVKRNRQFLPVNEGVNALTNDCTRFKDCQLKDLCCTGCRRRYCRNCQSRDCRNLCELYAPGSCSRCDRAPYVCNGCRTRLTCPLPRYLYKAKVAQAMAEERAVESRAGLDMTQEELDGMLSIVRKGLTKGQSIYHIFQSNDMPCTTGNFYRLVKKGALNMAALELPKAVRYKKRKRQKPKNIHEQEFYKGRTFDDFMALPECEIHYATQGDTVWGPKNETESLLSLHRIDLHFQLFFRIEERTPEKVVEVFDYLEKLLGSPEMFERLFDPMLLDRGTEFDGIEEMERSCLVEGARRCRVFFTDPQRPDQKGCCEKNHVELRKVCPKGTSFKPLNAYMLAEITSHVNSTLREKCNGVSPMEQAQLVFPKEFLDDLGLRLVAPEDVVCKPGILYDPKGGDTQA